MNLLLKHKTGIFLTFIGLVSTLSQYRFGVDDQLDHLLFVQKAMDANFLDNDWYVSATSGFSVRFYFAHFVAFFSKLLGVELAFFVLTLFSNIALSFSTFLIAEQLFSSKWSGFFASIIVMTIPTINMGDFSNLFATGLAPDRLAIPLMGFAFLFLLRKQLALFAVLTGIASLFHILLGFVIGNVFWISYIFFEFFIKRKNISWQIIIPGFILLGFALFTFVPIAFSNGESISSNDFLDIYVFFRVPHHLVPSVIFSNGIGIRTICFFSAVLIIAYQVLKNGLIKKPDLAFIGIITLLFAFICLAGYLLIEVFHHKLGAYLQAFRYLTMVKWLAYILIGSYIGILFSQKQTSLQGMVLLLSLSSPFLFCFYVLGYLLYQFIKERWPVFKPAKFILPVLLVTFFLIRGFYNETVVLVILAFIVFAYFKTSSKLYFFLQVACLVVIMINLTLPSSIKINVKMVDNWFDVNFRPVFKLSKYTDSKIDINRFIKNNLPVDACLVTPPDFSNIGMVANRASVVSFKLVPFSGGDLMEWKNRIDFCYGKTQAVGFEAEKKLVRKYATISESKLIEIKAKYNSDYAILPINSNVNFPIIYSNKEYKLCFIP